MIPTSNRNKIEQMEVNQTNELHKELDFQHHNPMAVVNKKGNHLLIVLR